MTRARVAAVAALAALAGCVTPPAGEELAPWDARRPHDAAATTARDTAPSEDDAAAAAAGERKARAAALRLRVTGPRLLGAASGSGFAVDEDTVVTNAHVVADGTDVAMTTWDGHDLDATATASSVRHDLALLATDAPVPVEPLELADADPAAGEEVVVVGYPDGGRITVDDAAHVIGTAAGGDYAGLFADEVLPEQVVRLAARTVRPGSSGGPVLNADGEVVAVVFAVTTRGGHEVLAVPVTTLRGWLAEQ